MDQKALKEAREAAMTTTLDQRALKAPRVAIATQVQRDRKARRLVFELMRCYMSRSPVLSFSSHFNFSCRVVPLCLLLSPLLNQRQDHLFPPLAQKTRHCRQHFFR